MLTSPLPPGGGAWTGTVPLLPSHAYTQFLPRSPWCLYVCVFLSRYPIFREVTPFQGLQVSARQPSTQDSPEEPLAPGDAQPAGQPRPSWLQ